MSTNILVIADEALESDALTTVIDPGVRVLVVAPALNSRLRHWLSDSDAAEAAARRRLARSLQRLQEAGIAAEGMVGDADPLQAAADALHAFDAARIVAVEPPIARSNWLARSLVERLRRRFTLPVVHVVVDAERPRGTSSCGKEQGSPRPREAIRADERPRGPVAAHRGYPAASEAVRPAADCSTDWEAGCRPSSLRTAGATSVPSSSIARIT